MPESVDVTHFAGGVFDVSRDVSDRTVFWGEAFNDRERHFLRKHLQSQTIGLPAKQHCNIKVRLLWQSAEDGPKAARGRAIMLLHAFSGELTSSWAWIKVAMPLFKQGHNLVLVDFPGFGRSSVRDDPHSPPSAWRPFDWQIVSQLMSLLQLRLCTFLATGESCATVLRIMRHMPGIVDRPLLFHDPVLDMDELFPKNGGLSGVLTEELRREQSRELQALLASARAKLWATFSEEQAATQETWQELVRAKKTTRLFISVTRLTRQQLCRVRLGARLPDSALFPCRYLKRRWADFVVRPQWMPERLPEGCAGEAPQTPSEAEESAGEASLPELAVSPGGKPSQRDTLLSSGGFYQSSRSGSWGQLPQIEELLERSSSSATFAEQVQEAMTRTQPIGQIRRRERLTHRYTNASERFNSVVVRPSTAVDKVDLYPVLDDPLENVLMNQMRLRHGRGSCYRYVPGKK